MSLQPIMPHSTAAGQAGPGQIAQSPATPAAPKFNLDFFERLKEDINFMESQFTNARRDVEQLIAEKNEIQRQYHACYEMAYQLNKEVHKLTEMNNRVHTIFNKVMTHLPPEIQTRTVREVELAKADVENAFRVGGPMLAYPVTASHSQTRIYTNEPNQNGFSSQQQQAQQTILPTAFRPLNGNASLPGQMAYPHTQQSTIPSTSLPVMVTPQQLQPPTPAASPSTSSRKGKAGRPPKERSSNNGNTSASAKASKKVKVEKLDESEERSDDELMIAEETPQKREPKERKAPASQNLQELAVLATSSPKATPPSLPIAEEPHVSRDHSVPVTKEPAPHKVVAAEPPIPIVDGALPNDISMIATLPHKEVVCAVAISNPYQYIFTGGKGSVKVWDASSPNPIMVKELFCLQDNYIRSCKLTSDSTTMVVAGECNTMAIWDLSNIAAPVIKGELHIEGADAVYGIAISANGQLCFSCCSDGRIMIWDIHQQRLIRTLSGHADGASCIQVSQDGKTLLTGGLDCQLRIWDISTGEEISQFTFPSQIFALGLHPTQPLVAVGLESSHVQLLDLSTGSRRMLNLHDSCILSLKFAPSGRWFITTGKDNILSCCKSPDGPQLFKLKEAASILCSDISGNSEFIITGSGEKVAHVYQVKY